MFNHQEKGSGVLRRLLGGANLNLDRFERDAVSLGLRKPSDETAQINETTAAVNEAYNRNSLIDDADIDHSVQTFGEDVPPAVDSFEMLQQHYQLPGFLMRNLRKAGFIQPTPVQTQAVPLMMMKRELICCSFTGSGKTVAFLLPIIAHLCSNPLDEDEVNNDSGDGEEKIVRSVILAPTCELAKQIYRECLWFAHGGHLQCKLINNVYKFQLRRIDILITTPKRLVYLLKKCFVQLNYCEYLVVDECDRLFDHSFRPQLVTIYQACAQSSRISRALFSATFNRKLEKWFQLNLDNVVTLLVGRKLQVPRSIRQELRYVGDSNGKYMALQEIIHEGIQPPVLIFCQYRRNALDLLSRFLRDKQVNVSLIHSGLCESKRMAILQRFREGHIWFLICTDLMGRGMDFKGVSCLINYDYPHDHVSYIHRIGRTGRAGKFGRAITLFTNEEVEHPTKLKYIVQIMKQSGWPVPDYLTDVKKLELLPRTKRQKKFYTKTGKLEQNQKQIGKKHQVERSNKSRKLMQAK